MCWIVKSELSVCRIPFKIWRGFFGIINSETSLAVYSVVSNLTSLWASVATNLRDSLLNWKKTPLITGLRSSVPDAKIVEFIAFPRSDPFITVSCASRISTCFGNSSPLRYAKEYLPLLALISIVLLSVLINVKGCSEKVLRISVRSLADIAILSVDVDSISIWEVIVDSRSEELKTSLLLFISNKKLSRIGKVLDELIIPPKTWISL